MLLTSTDREWIEARALAAGFDLAGVAAVPESESPSAQRTDARFQSFVEHGHAADMEWLKRTDDRGEFLRGDLRRAFPWARSVLVCAISYNVAAPLSTAPANPGTGWIARYAWSGQGDVGMDESEGSDYHDVLLPKLRLVEEQLRQRFGADCITRSYVDTGPVLERDYAQRAGVGWIGKNTCVLNQGQGSWLLLGVIVTSLDLVPDALTLPAADRCGTCTRCLDACPTNALIAPRQMDASLCIAYLTIEKKGSIPEELRSKMGRQVFGCDICQDVCPWNRRAPVSQTSPLPPRGELVNPALAWLASLDGAEFNRWFKGSPLERTRRKRVLRNVAIAMGNSGEAGFLPQLEVWAGDASEPVLAEAAGWAVSRLLKAAPAASRQAEEPS